jgi:C-terminal processing protease CtpA/Prc
MLADLGDPATNLVEPTVAAPASATTSTAPGAAAQEEHLPGGVLSLRLVRLAGFMEAQQEVDRLRPALQAAKGVLLDLRRQPPVVAGVEDVGDELELLAPLLVDGPLVPLPQRQAFYSGYPPQTGMTSGGYFSGLLVQLPSAPADAGPPRKPGATPERVVLLTDATSPVTSPMLSLQRAGARVVGEGPLDLSWVSRTWPITIAPGLQVRIRASEFEREPAPDLLVPPAKSGKGDPAREAALALVRGKPLPKSQPSPPAGPPLRAPGWLQEKPYGEMAYPALEYRWLAVARLWNVIHYFYPYLSLLDQPWDETLPLALTAVEAAQDEEQWLHALLRIAARINDAHTGLYGRPKLQALVGEAGVGIKLQLLGGEPVVAGFDYDLAKSAGVLPGDVIETVDGEPLRVKAGRLEPEVAASLPTMRAWRAAGRALRGPFGSEVTLGLRAPDGATRAVKLTRPQPTFRPGPESTEPPYKKLAGNVGYVELARLEPQQVGAMFDALMDTRALVFDLRCYPRGTAWAIAPRINTKGARFAALFQRAEVTGGLSEATDQRFQFKQRVPESDLPVYRGRVVVLIDEFAISQSEHTGLFFENAADVTFVGSVTQGANGDVTNTVLPGGLTLTFTGHDVRHADGRQLQRVGLQPQIAVRPTPAGLRAGRDEVLERALEEIGPEKR